MCFFLLKYRGRNCCDEDITEVLVLFFSNKSCFQGLYLYLPHSYRIIQVASQGVAKCNTSACDYFQEEEPLLKRVCQRYSWHVGLCNHTR